MHPLTTANYRLLLFLACLALPAEAVVNFPFFFAPGWANGWPGGLTIYQVWSTWLSITLFVMLMTFGLGLGSLISLLFCIFPRGRRHAANALGTWISFWAILSAVTR